MAKNARVLQEWLHLYDGLTRDKRDEMMKKDDTNDSMLWGFSKRKDWLFGHDAQKLDCIASIPALPSMPLREASVY
jgi:salicylate hydroxylase